MFAYLKATSGVLEGGIFTLGTRTLLGRAAESDVQLAEVAVSRHHALILRLDEGQYWIGDLASTNGTFVSGSRIESHCLQPGDRIQVGKSTLAFEEAERPLTALGMLAEEGFRLLSGPANGRTCGLSLASLQTIWEAQRQSARRGRLGESPFELDETLVRPRSSLGSHLAQQSVLHS